MNWRDYIWAQTRSRGRRSRCVKLAMQRLVPYSENKGYASNPRRFQEQESQQHSSDATVLKEKDFKKFPHSSIRTFKSFYKHA